jgi:ABC-type molybdate transport system substrate-binding protein
MTIGSKIAAVAAVCLSAIAVATPARAAEIVLTSSTAMREAVEELAAMFERASGNKVTMTFQSGVETSAKIEAGAVADLVVTTPEAIDELTRDGKLVAGTRVNFVQSSVTPELGQRVGNLVARGEAEIGVQQITELLPIPGIDFLGPLPNELQTKIGYATARLASAKQPQAAAALAQFMSSEAALPVMKKMGMEPW